ncbi:MAG TPA: sedoheptulose 7-phosphate cyclase [Candidatus Eremiobacteraceae bacterium]|nr:sedoheptulose 7-phosphate cyclase [Candidatus Eremiobacteraceae bacterium]
MIPRSTRGPETVNRTSVHDLIVSCGARGRWTATLVDRRTSIVVATREVEAASLVDPTVRELQLLGERLIYEMGDAGTIVLLLDKLCAPEQLEPSLLTSYPVPMLAASPTVEAAACAPVKFTHFCLLDFTGRGAMAIVNRGRNGCIRDLSMSTEPLTEVFKSQLSSDANSGDLLVDLFGSMDPVNAEASIGAVWLKLTSVLAAPFSFGYSTVVCASRLFDDQRWSAAFTSFAVPAHGRPFAATAAIGTSLAAEVSRRARSLTSSPGTWMGGDRNRKTLAVVAPRTIRYEVTHVSRHMLDPEEPALEQLLEGRGVMFVIDQAVDVIYGRALRDYASTYLNCKAVVPIDGSENHKHWDQVETICDHAIRSGLRRDGVIAAIGGGVTLDVAGVAASMYRRGIRFARIPTTLIGLVDVCVGIKQGINFHDKKNILGAFYPPFGGINDLTFLKSLSRRHISCGIAEVIKMGVVRDPFLFELLEAHTASLLDSHFQAPRRTAEQIVIRAELAMMNELQPNLFEDDLCRLADFGHTFSPALELASHFEVAHGEAVAIDMMLASALAVGRGLCQPAVVDRLLAVYRLAALPTTHVLCEPSLMSTALEDAIAHRAGNLNMVVPTGIGTATFVQDVSGPEIAASVRMIADLEDASRTEAIDASGSR